MKKPFNNQPWLLLVFPAILGVSVMVSCETQPGQIPTVEQEVAAVQERMIEKSPDEMASFPGGQQAMYTFLMEHMKYPEEAKKEGLEGRVFVQFTIATNGQITDVIALNKDKGDHPPHASMVKEALRVMDQMPDWEPAKKDGKLVATQMTLPFMFKLPE